MPDFLQLGIILLNNQSEESGEKQISVFGSACVDPEGGTGGPEPPPHPHPEKSQKYRVF